MERDENKIVLPDGSVHDLDEEIPLPEDIPAVGQAEQQGGLGDLSYQFDEADRLNSEAEQVLYSDAAAWAPDPIPEDEEDEEEYEEEAPQVRQSPLSFLRPTPRPAAPRPAKPRPSLLKLLEPLPEEEEEIGEEEKVIPPKPPETPVVQVSTPPAPAVPEPAPEPEPEPVVEQEPILASSAPPATEKDILPPELLVELTATEPETPPAPAEPIPTPGETTPAPTEQASAPTEPPVQETVPPEPQPEPPKPKTKPKTAPEKPERQEDEEEEGKTPFRLHFSLPDEVLTDIYRTLLGLIFLTCSAMRFIPATGRFVLGLLAVLICGYPVFYAALQRVLDRRYLSEELAISVAAVLAAVIGHAPDGVLAMVLADIGFALRDNFLGKLSEEAVERLGEKSSLEDRHLQPAWATRLSTFYTPVLMMLALVMLILAIIFGGTMTATWIYRALVLVAASSPLATAVVLALNHDYGKLAARERGVIFDNCKSIHGSAALSSIIFNKTGTLTVGRYKVSGLFPVKISEQQLLYLARYAETGSAHPLARAIAEYAGIQVDKSRVIRTREEKGVGVITQLSGGNIISIGSIELMEKLGIHKDVIPGIGVSAYVAVGKAFVGRIDFEDNIKPGARETVSQLRKLGVVNVALMTGDNSISATNLGREVGITEIYADCLPKDKYDRIQYIVRSQQKNEKLAFVVGPESDIPALRLADVGIVIGESEGDSSALVTIPSGELTVLPQAVRYAKLIRSASTRGVILLLVAKALGLALGFFGFLPLTCVLLFDIAALLVDGLLAKGLMKKA